MVFFLKGIKRFFRLFLGFKKEKPQPISVVLPKAYRVAFITGAARRVGAQIARALHENDYKVLIHCHRSTEEAEKLVRELNATRPDSACVFYHDLSNVDVFPVLMEQAVNCWGKLHLLINNASCFFSTPLEQTTPLLWNNLMAINLKAPFFLSQAAWPYLKREEGNIINIADIHAFSPLRRHAVYSIAKAGLVMATQALAKEMAPFVRVNAVAPGLVLLPEGENALTAEQQLKIIEKNYLKRIGMPLDVAQACLYLANANYVTGQVIEVAGGRRGR